MAVRIKNVHIRDAFQACQASYSTHPHIVKKLRKIYDSSDEDKFFESFIYYLRLPISGVQERSIFTKNILEFVAKFACSFLKKAEKENEKEDKDEEKEKGEQDEKEKEKEEEDEEEFDDELPLFLYRLFVWLLDHHAVEGVDARLRVCQLLNRLLKYMGEEACIDDELYNKLYYGMLERLQDKVADIRSQAVTALQRLQDPKNDECPIIKAYLFHIAHDPNSTVRRTIVGCIGATRLTLRHILERTRDEDEMVRRAAYKFLAEKVHLKSLTIGQREGVLQRGLKERSEGVRKVVEKELISRWLHLSGSNIIQLLHHLDVGNSEQDFKAGKQLSAPAGALEVLFSDINFPDLTANFQYLDEDKLIPTDKLTPETALYWRVLIQFLSRQINSEDYIDALRPELTPFCDYVRSFILSQSAQDDELNWEFVAKELIIMCSFYDLGDDYGRRNLAKLIKDLLISDKISANIIPQLVHIFTKVEKSAQSRIDQIAEVIAELKDPMSKEAAKVLETQMEVESAIDHKLIRSLQLEIAKLMVDLSSQKDALEEAITTQDFLTAQQVKQTIMEIEERRAALEADIVAEKAKAQVVAAPAPEVNEDAEDPAITLKCLKLLVATLQDPHITHLNITLHTLLNEFIVVSVQSEISSIRREAIIALACFCLRSIEDARMHMLLLLQAAHIDVPEVRIAAITAVIDLLTFHGLGSFITAAPASADTSGGTEAELFSETSSSIENALESDMATRGATLTQTELNAQGGNSVVAILSKMLDEPDLELRTEVAEGLCKLLMRGAISSPKLISRLLLMWYNPMTESDSKLRHILGTFFPLYASMVKGHQTAIQCAFIPTMRILFDAPVTSPLAEIDTEDVGMFFVHLTREDLLQSFEGVKPSLEGESTVTSVHDTLAASVCNEILSAPDSLQTKVLVKILSNLQITHNNFVGLRELKVLSEQLLKHVKDKLCRKSLEKFDKNVAEWLSRDPSKAVDALAEKRPADPEPVDETTDISQTPGKKKRILFSQSVLGNPLLHPEHDSGTPDHRNTAGVNISPRKIPSPVVMTNKRVTNVHSPGSPFPEVFEETLDSTIAGTKNLAIDSAQQGITALDSMEDNVEVDSTEGNLDSMQGLTLSTDNESESEQDRVTVVPATPESSQANSTDSEEMYGTPIGGSSPSVVAETPSPPKRRSRLSKGTSAAKSKSKASVQATPAKTTPRPRKAVPGTPDRAKEPGSPDKARQSRQLIPSSPGISRSGRRNSPRIDYRTGRDLTSELSDEPVQEPTNQKSTKTAATKSASAVKPSAKASAAKTKAASAAKLSSGSATSTSSVDSPSRKRAAPQPSEASRNSSPALRVKTPRSKTPAGKENAAVAGLKSVLSGVRPLRGNKSGSDSDSSPGVRKSSRSARGGSDTDSSAASSPVIGKGKKVTASQASPAQAKKVVATTLSSPALRKSKRCYVSIDPIKP